MTRDNPNRSDYSADRTGSQEQSETYRNSFRVGVYEGWPVHIGVAQTPAEASVPQEFGVNLFIPNGDGENVNIARIDTDHAGCHMDRLYLPEDTDERRQDYTVQYQTPSEAIQHFLDNKDWRYYTERFQENHGLPKETKIY